MATYESRRYNTPVTDVTKIADGSVNNTEFETLDGVTSDIQTQLNARLPLAGGTMSGNLDLNDNVRLRAGDSQDFEFFHDSSNSYIKNGTGVIVIQSDTVQFKNAANNDTFLTINSSSSFLSLADVYPVGSIYTNAVNSTNPSSLLGFGTWTRFGEGRMLISQLSSDSDFDTAEETGGAKTHTLTVNEMPSHTHTFNQYAGDGANNTINQLNTTDEATQFPKFTTDATGGGASHNNMPPYIVVYMWKRTA